jgi:hypothetical protein
MACPVLAQNKLVICTIDIGVFNTDKISWTPLLSSKEPLEIIALNGDKGQFWI